MPDLVAQFGLDDSGFESGLRRTERQTIDSAQRVYRQTTAIAGRAASEQEGLAARVQSAYTKGWAAVEKAISSAAVAGALVARSVRDYGDQFSYARGQAEDLGRAVDRFKTSLGRDLSGAGGGGLLADIIDMTDRARVGIVNFAADLASLSPGKSDKIDALRKGLEAADIQAGQITTATDARLAVDIRAAEARGDTAAAAELRIRQRRRELDKRLAGQDLTEGDRQDIRARELAVITREERARVREQERAAARTADEEDARRYKANQAALDRVEEIGVSRRVAGLRAAGHDDIAAGVQFEFELSRKVRALRQSGAGEDAVAGFTAAERAANADAADQRRKERESRRAERVDSYVLAEKSLRVDQLRLQGKSREADILRATIDAEERIAKIRADDLLTIQEKNRFIASEREGLDAEINFLNTPRRAGAVRSLHSGVGDALLRRQVLGGPGSTADKQLAEAKTQTGLLKTIADKTGVYA